MKMKRIITLLLAAGMVLGAISQASALEIEAKGQFLFTFGWQSNNTFSDQDDDTFNAGQRIRVQADFIASENLRGVLQFQIGPKLWGDTSNKSGNNGQLDGNDTDVRTRRAYIQWDVPQTNLQFTMGLQQLGLPSATFGNPVFDTHVYGVVASYDFTDEIALAMFWARPYYDTGKYSKEYKNNSTDLFGIALSMDFKDYLIAPWFVYGRVGNSSGFWQDRIRRSATRGGYTGFGNQDLPVDPKDYSISMDDDSDLYVGGFAFKAKNLFTDGLSLGVDAMYGVLNNSGDKTYVNDELFADEAIETRGWMVAARLDYKTEYGTPGLFGWYASGDNADDAKDDAKLGRLPVMGDDAYGFKVTSFGFAGGYGVYDDQAISTSGIGTWGVGMQWADISFIEKLTHTVRVAYYRGTNDKDAAKYLGGILGETVYMTKGDSAIEVNLDSKYQIYENLTAALELGYIHLNVDDDVKGASGIGDRSDLYNESNAWKVGLSFNYEF